MVEEIIRIILSNYTVTFFILAILAGFLSLHSKRQIQKSVIIEAFFRYFLLFSVGLSFLYNFVMHTVFAESAAKFIGWAPSPFQFEVGVASLGISICGFMAFRANWPFRLATLIVPIVFNWGAAIGHVYQMIAHHNFAPGNAGTMFWSDILFPIIGILLLWLAYRNPPPENTTRT